MWKEIVATLIKIFTKLIKNALFDKYMYRTEQNRVVGC